MPVSFTPEEVFVPVAQGRIHTLQWGAGPLLLFAHATGMCARAYLDLLGPLGGKFRVVAADARGHGRTELPMDAAQIPADWKIFRQDLAQLVQALGGGPVRLAGHSFGATTCLETAAANPGLASSVCVIEPALVAFELAAEMRAKRDRGEGFSNHLADLSIKRRANFPSRAEAAQRYHGRGVFAGWPDAAFAGYIADGLLDDADGAGVHLACRPDIEAITYRGVSTTFEASLRAIDVPLSFLLGGEGSMIGAAEEAVIRRVHPDARVERCPGTAHFLPITHPELVRPHLLALP